MPLRAFLVLAILAASLGTPSVAFGVRNTLSPEAPDPATGTTETLFGFRVAYEGRSEALGVTLDVAGWSLPMSLVAGSSTSGTWSTATTLPAGTWVIGYAASVAQGNAPSAEGGSITVSQAEATPSGGASTEAIAPAPSATPQTDPVAAPATATPAAAAAPTGSAEPATEVGAGAPAPPARPAPGGPPSTPPGAVTPAGAPVTGSPTGSVGAATEAATATHATAGGIPFAVGAGPARRDPGTTLALILALAGLLGLLLVVLAARRPRTATATVTSGPSAPRTAESPPQDAVSAALERRTLRRARLRLDDDPIVASLISERPARRRPPRATEVQRGPGVRERDR